MIVVIIILSITTVKKFDSLLSSNNIPLPLSYACMLPKKWGRAVIYAILLLGYNLNKKNNLSKPRYLRYKHIYGEFNFYHQASLLDILLATFMLLFTAIGICSLLMIIAKQILI